MTGPGKFTPPIRAPSSKTKLKLAIKRARKKGKK